MRTIRPRGIQKGKGRVRELVRRGSRSDRSPAVALRTRHLPEPCMCERCGAVYRRKRWRRGTSREIELPIGFGWTVCPACRQVESGQYFGRVVVSGERALREEAGIRRRIHHIAERAAFTQPERRIVAIERRGDELEVLATSQKLAHRIAASLADAFGGKASYQWAERDGELGAIWRWHDVPSRPPATHGRKRASARSRAEVSREAAAVVGKQVPDLEIQLRHATPDPRWRDLIESAVARWSERYPELTRVHVTLSQGRHHRTGFEEASIVAICPRKGLRAAKRGERMPEAIHAALGVMTRKLREAHQERRRVVKSPGPRPQGSVKSIFRDGGFGFILLGEGREAYFHRRALHGLRFESLAPGLPVEVELEAGARGLQASRVFPVGQRGLS